MEQRHTVYRLLSARTKGEEPVGYSNKVLGVAVARAVVLVAVNVGGKKAHAYAVGGGEGEMCQSRRPRPLQFSP